MSDPKDTTGKPGAPPAPRRTGAADDRDSRPAGEAGAPVSRWGVAMTRASAPAPAPRGTAAILAPRRQLEAELGAERRRSASAEARCRELEHRIARTVERLEEQSVIAAELRTMLDATEYRITTLEAEVRAREGDVRQVAERHAEEVGRFAEERTALHGALADAARERAEERARRWMESAAVAERQERVREEGEALGATLAARSAECSRLGEALDAAEREAAELRKGIAETSALLEQAFGESEELRACGAAAAREIERERARAEIAAAERDEVSARLSAALIDLADRTAALGSLEQSAGELAAAREAAEGRAEILATLVSERTARIDQLELALGSLAAEREEAERSLEGIARDFRAVGFERARLDAELEEARRLVGELRASVAADVRRGEDDRGRAAALGRALAAARDEARVLGAELASRSAALDELRAEVRRASEDGAALDRQVETLRVQLSGALSRLAEEGAAVLEERSERARENENLRRELEIRDADAGRLGADLARSFEAIARLEADLIERQRQGALDAETIRRLTDASRGAGEELAEARAQGARAAEDATRAAEEVARLAQDAAAARAALERREAELARRDAELAIVSKAREVEREEAARRAEREAVERTELSEVLALASRELEELQRRSALDSEAHATAFAAASAEGDRLAAALADAHASQRVASDAIVELRSLLARRDDEVCALRFAFEQSQLSAEQASERQAELICELDGLERQLAAANQIASEAEVAGTSRDELAARIGDLEQTEQLLRGREATLQGAIDQLQQQLLREQTHAAGLWNDLQCQTRFREALDSALAEARSRSAELESMLERERERRADEAASQRAAAELAALNQVLETRLAEATAESATMGERLDAAAAIREALERECEQLKRRVATGDDRERQRGESAKLQARVEELERQQREATQRHTAAVNGYMLELNQRTDVLRQRDAEIHHLAEEIAVLQATCDDAVAQLAEIRSSRDLHGARAREAAAERATSRNADASGGPALPSRIGEREERPARDELRIAEPKRDEKKRPAAAQQVRRGSARAMGEPLVVLHVDDDTATQEAVRTTLAQFPVVRYAALGAQTADPPAGRRVLAVNMLSRTVDPLATITESSKLGIGDPSAFTYFAYGGRGFTLGIVDFFPHPFEVDACASRLLGRPGGLQRLLAVSEDVDLMSGVREVLGRVRCSVATAFDGRQALDLVPMIKPEVLLVDLALPRGEALRIVSRLRTDPKTASISIAMLWTTPMTHKEVAQSALRVVRDFPLTPAEVGSSLERVLTDEEVGLIGGEAIREVG